MSRPIPKHLIRAQPTETHVQEIYLPISQFDDDPAEYIDNIDDFQRQDDYLKAYVDPTDLSYHSFENILAMDQLLTPLLKKSGIKTITEPTVTDGLCAFQISRQLISSLLTLHQKQLYTLPFNNQSRGGQRMIFSSVALANLLTEIIESEPSLHQSDEFFVFRQVNSVFRLNCFAPGDRKFQAHYDTPFMDKQRHYYSRKTLLIYLSTGTNPSGCLVFPDQTIKQIEVGDAFIFDQSLEHEGNPFVDGQKIFIRTELIYYCPSLTYREEVAQAFNMACYFTKEAVRTPELQKYASDLFNHTTKLRYAIASQVPMRWLFKRNHNVVYLTNGQDFYFPQEIELKSAALLVILDYFNGQTPKQKNQIISKEYSATDLSTEAIFQFLNVAQFGPVRETNQLDFNRIIKEEPQVSILEYACGICDPDEMAQNSEDYYEEAVDLAQSMLDEKLKGFSVVLFDGQLHIEASNLEVKEKVITINSPNLMAAINFASCQCETYSANKIMGKKRQTLQALSFPELAYQVFSNGTKISLDLFQNGCVFNEVIDFAVPVPCKPDRNDRIDLPKFYFEDTDKYNYSDDEADEDLIEQIEGKSSRQSRKNRTNNGLWPVLPSFPQTLPKCVTRTTIPAMTMRQIDISPVLPPGQAAAKAAESPRTTVTPAMPAVEQEPTENEPIDAEIWHNPNDNSRKYYQIKRTNIIVTEEVENLKLVGQLNDEGQLEPPNEASLNHAKKWALMV